jgi:hypothetical protein
VEAGGSHITRVEEGFLFFVPRGPVAEDDVRELIRRGDELARSWGGYWLLIDVRSLGAVDAKARRVAATNPGIARFRGCAIFGASAVSRTLITLIVRGMAMLGHSHIEIRFFDDESEAREWIGSRVRASGKS